MPATVLAERVECTGSIRWFSENVKRLRLEPRPVDPADRLKWAPGEKRWIGPRRRGPVASVASSEPYRFGQEPELGSVPPGFRPTYRPGPLQLRCAQRSLHHRRGGSGWLKVTKRRHDERHHGRQ